MARPEDITRHVDADPDDPGIIGGPSEPELVEIVEPDPSWPARFGRLADEIRGALGDRVLAIEHVGSTSVPDLPAKPVIDISLAVADPTDEAQYVAPLEGLGYELRIREPGWHEHRLFQRRAPKVNLHVFGLDCPEVIRHILFRDWLRDHPDDRARYAAAKRDAASATNAAGENMMRYNLRKQAVIREILDTCFRANGLLD